jgi:hypothetical protein
MSRMKTSEEVNHCMYRVTCKQINTRKAHPKKFPSPHSFHAADLSVHANILHAHPYKLFRPEYQRTTTSCPFISPTNALLQPFLHLINPINQPHAAHQPPCAPYHLDNRHLGAPDPSELASQCSVTEDIATLHSTNTADMESLANQLIE